VPSEHTRQPVPPHRRMGPDELWRHLEAAFEDDAGWLAAFSRPCNHAVTTGLSRRFRSPIRNTLRHAKSRGFRQLSACSILERAMGFEPTNPTLASRKLPRLLSHPEFTVIDWSARNSAISRGSKILNNCVLGSISMECSELGWRPGAVTAR
jgi:hypothetical protein